MRRFLDVLVKVFGSFIIFLTSFLELGYCVQQPISFLPVCLSGSRIKRHFPTAVLPAFPALSGTQSDNVRITVDSTFVFETVVRAALSLRVIQDISHHGRDVKVYPFPPAYLPHVQKVEKTYKSGGNIFYCAADVGGGGLPVAEVRQLLTLVIEQSTTSREVEHVFPRFDAVKQRELITNGRLTSIQIQ